MGIEEYALIALISFLSAIFGILMIPYVLAVAEILRETLEQMWSWLE